MRWWRRLRARWAVRREACAHCNGSGILMVERVGGEHLGGPYAASCHACPAGRAWAEAIMRLEETR